MFYLRFPFTQGARGYLEPRLRGHVAAAELRVREGFRYQGAATFRRLYEVFAALANGEAVSPLLSGYEEHSLRFFG